MSIRILQHILFWMTFIMLYVIMHMFFPSESDLKYSAIDRFFRFFLLELVFLPWKVIPFYFLFYYLIPKYFRKKSFLKIGLYLLGVIILCLIGYRSMIAPVSEMLYGDIPEGNLFSLKRFIYTFLSYILPAIGLAASVKLLKGSIASQQKEEALQSEKLKAELNFLKAQTNPHFLFNTLNNLYGLARRKDDNTADSILKLSNIMRYILHECSADTTPIDNEIKVIEDYIELEKLRYDNRLKITFAKNIDNYAQAIPPLILLPFVENAFKHGASENRFDIFINIKLALENKQLVFNIENSKEEGDVTLQEGVGLKNIKRQLDLIYGKNYTLKITSSENVFSVALFIQTLE